MTSPGSREARDLLAALDVRAAVRLDDDEASIPVRYANLVGDLRTVLDIEAGLNAIVSGADTDSRRRSRRGAS